MSIHDWTEIRNGNKPGRHELCFGNNSQWHIILYNANSFQRESARLCPEYQARFNSQKLNDMFGELKEKRKFHKTFDNFEINSKNKEKVALVRGFYSGLQEKMFLYGSSRTGKTHLLMALIHDLSKKNKKVWYKEAEGLKKMFVSLEVWENVVSYENAKFDYENMINSDVIIIDDLGKERKDNGLFEEKFKSLLDNVNINQKIIIASNFDIDNLRFDDSVRNRLNENCLKIKADWQPYRF